MSDKEEEKEEAEVRGVAQLWVSQGIEPTHVELCAELLARMSREGSAISQTELEAAVGWLDLPQEITEFLKAATSDGSPATIGTLSLHLLDIAERMALAIFLPELGALCARSERSAQHARAVGLARHLKG